MGEKVLDQWQLAAAHGHPHHSHAVLAVPGAGKTEVIAERVAWLVRERIAMPSQITALTFTRAMAADLSRRIRERCPTSVPCRSCDGTGKRTSAALGIDFDCDACAGVGYRDVGQVAVGTLHSMCAQWARLALAEKISGRREVLNFGWIDETQTDTTGNPTFRVATEDEVDAAVTEAQRQLGGAKRITKKALVAGFELALGAGPVPREAQARAVLRSWGMVRYDDLLTFGRAITVSDMGSIVRRRPVMIVDEAQDLTDEHAQVLIPWLAGSQDPGGISLFAVGDDAQAIYGFASKSGVTGRLLADMASGDLHSAPHGTPVESGPAGALVVQHRLRINYRSSTAVVAMSGSLRNAMAAAGLCQPMSILCERAECHGSVTERVVTLPESMCTGETGGACVADQYVPEGVEPTPAAVVAAVDEALFMADRPEDVVVLAATRAELDEVEDALAAAGIASGRLERRRDAWSSPRGVVAVEILRAYVAQSWDVRGLRALAAVNFAGLTPGAVDRAETNALVTRRSLAEVLDEMPERWPEAHSMCLRWSDVTSGNLREGVIGAVAVMLSGSVDSPLATWSADGYGGKPEDFLTWLSSDETARVVRPVGKVCLSTMHGAKGLEWQRVVVVGMCEGACPPRFARGDEKKQADWHRAVYVAATRARDGVTFVTPRWLRGKPRAPHALLTSAGVLADFNPTV